MKCENKKLLSVLLCTMLTAAVLSIVSPAEAYPPGIFVDATGPYGTEFNPYYEGDMIYFEAQVWHNGEDLTLDFAFRWDVDNDGTFDGPGDSGDDYFGDFGENSFIYQFLDDYHDTALVQAWDGTMIMIDEEPVPDLLEDTADVYVDNIYPLVFDVQADPVTADIESPIEFTAKFYDLGLDDTWEYRWIWGDGTYTDWIYYGGIGGMPMPLELPVTTHSYTEIIGGNPEFTVQVNVRDDDSGSDYEEIIVTVIVTSPIADAGLDQITGVGNTVTFDGSNSYDPDGDIVYYNWNFNDGSHYTETPTDYPDGAFDGITTHVYNTEGVYLITFLVMDNHGAYDVDTCIVTVGPDLTLSSSDITFNPTSPAAIGTDVTITTNVHNDGGGDANDVLVRFFDDTTQVGEVTITSISSGSSEQAQILWTATPKGMHTINVVVDPDNQISEVKENNNEASSNIWVEIFVPTNYATIGEAISAASSGDTINVLAGIYNENIVINKHLTLIGEGSDVTIINGGGSGTTVTITADNVDIIGFNIMGGDYGIYCDHTTDAYIAYSEISMNNDYGIYLDTTTGDVIEYNHISQNNFDSDDTGTGLYALDSNAETVWCNNISYNKVGVKIDNSWLWDCLNCNTFYQNEIAVEYDPAPLEIDSNIFIDNTVAIKISGAGPSLVISCNTIIDSDIAIYIESGSPLIDNNDMYDNAVGIYIESGSPTITDNTVTENFIGIYISEVANPEMYDNEVYANEIDTTTTSPTMTIDALIDLVENMELHPGIEYSLIAKLNAANDALSQGHVDTCINLLNAFINEVEAQRGIYITDSQADELVTAAGLLIYTIQ